MVARGNASIDLCAPAATTIVVDVVLFQANKRVSKKQVSGPTLLRTNSKPMSHVIILEQNTVLVSPHDDVDRAI